MTKLARKQGQAYRREARLMLSKNQAIYATQIAEKLKVFNEIVKPRPRFVPQWIWQLLARVFLDIPKLQKFLGNEQPNQQAPDPIEMDAQASVGIFKLIHNRLPIPNSADELTLDDLNKFIYKYANNPRYQTLVKYAHKFRDIEMKLSTDEAKK
jgi:hypothetical protein